MQRPSPVGMMLQFAFGSGPARPKSSGGPASQASDDAACESSPQMLALVTAAKAWWEASRPAGWSLEEHLADPTAGCRDGAQERALAEAVAQWVRQGA